MTKHPALALLSLCLPALVCCDEELPGDEICRDIGYAISNKSFECSGDVDAANKRYEDFTSKYPCKISEIPGEDQLLNDRISEPPRDSVGDPYQCSAAILQLSCDRVAQIGDDFDQWLAASPQCNAAYSPVGSSGQGGAAGSGGSAGQGGSSGAAGSGGEGGSAGSSGSGGAVDLTAQGTINGQSFSILCSHSPNADLAFQCHDSSGTGFFFVFRKLKSSSVTDFASFDAFYRVDLLLNNQFLPALAATDTFEQTSCTTSILAEPDPADLVSISVDAHVVRTSEPTFSLSLTGTATGVPCGNSCN